MKKTSMLFALLATAILAACGGGGDAGSASSTPQPAVTTLAGSGGDMSKYLGTWVSDCGYNISGSNQGKYQINSFQFTSVNGATVTGTLTINLYSDSNCSTSVSGSGGGLPTAVTATYQGSLTVTSGTPASAQGTADQVALAASGSSATQSYTVGFYSNFSKFLQGSGSLFNSASLSYRKAS